MAGSPPKRPAFRAERYELGQAGLWLSTIEAKEADALGQTLAAIEPWSTESRLRWMGSGERPTCRWICVLRDR